MKKILIVDDDVRGVTSNLAKALKEEGFDVSVLNDAERVIELLKLEKFDGIILDIMMPVPESWSSDLKRESDHGLETGIILFKIIRNGLPSIPIIFHTAKSSINIKHDRFTYAIKKPEFHNIIAEKLKELISMSPK